MPKINVKGQTVQAGELGQTHKRTLPSTLSPRLAVNNKRGHTLGHKILTKNMERFTNLRVILAQGPC